MSDKHCLLVWLIIPLIVLVFVYEMVLFGKIPLASDTVSHKPISKWVNEYAENNYDQAFWFPHFFSGMPAMGSNIKAPGNPINETLNFILFNRGLKYWFYFSIGGIGLYLLLRKRKLNKLAALFGGLIYSLTPYMFGLINAGHSSKIIALGYVPWVFLTADYCFRKRKWRGILFLGLVTALQLWSNHPQIVYYTWMIIVFWWIWNQVGAIFKKQGQIRREGKATLLMISGLLLAALIVATPYAFVYEFQGHSNRGAPSVLDQSGETESGVKWDYATQWSFQPKEVISFFYPYYYGLQNYPTRDLKIAYWGGMPFTQSTHYLGLLVLLVAVLGVVLKRPDRFETFFWVTSGLILLVGFGKYIPLLYGPLFNLAPFFSKFRVPSMIYALLPFTFGILSAIGLDNILKFMKGESDLNRRIIKKVVIIFGGFIGLTLVYLLFGNSIVSFLKPTEAGQYDPRVFAQIKSVRQDLFQKGILLALAISVGGFTAIWMGIKQKVKPLFVSITIITLTVVDLWVVDNEFLHLKNSRQMEQQFRPNKIIDFLTADNNLFRIFPVDELNTNWYGYFGLSSIGGYRPVKLRTYQDLMDAGGFNNVSVLNMLNVKYLITKRNIQLPDFEKVFSERQNIYQNLSVLPKAWIVPKIIAVETQKESLSKTMVSEFNPAVEAVVLDYDGPELEKNSSGTVTVNKYSENEIVLQSNSKTGGLLVLSENYYGPGWKATVDNNPSKIYQTNHVLRSIYVPSSDHTITFRYDDSLYKISKIISRISLGLVLLGIVYFHRKSMMLMLNKIRLK
ncbi:MAG: YfhO family protein [Candidatus Marinimicrobia bacterium]|nr:YfhO family protein [Candidatus Neomarinimicrobiota bacterium]